MVVLTEEMIIARSRGTDLSNIKKLNFWGSELSDVSVIRKLSNIEVVSLSVNQIGSLEDFQYCDQLQELYIRKNNINDINEVRFLQRLPKLKSLWLADNPCAEFDEYRYTVLKALPQLQKLDNAVVQQEEFDKASIYGHDLPYSDAVTCSADAKPACFMQVNTSIPDVPSEEAYNRDSYISCNVNSASEEVCRNVPSNGYKEEYEYSSSELSCSASQQSMSRNSSQAGTPGDTDTHPGSCLPSVSDSHNANYLKDHVQKYYADENEKNYWSPNGSVYNDMQYRQSRDGRTSRAGSEYSYSTRKSVCSPVAEGHSSPHSQYEYPESAKHDAKDPRKASADNYHYNNKYQRRSESLTPLTNGDSLRPYPVRPKTRNANLLSAVLCLIKELDYSSLEVVEMAVRCRMDEIEE